MRSPAETWTLLQTHLELGQAVNRPEYFFIECAGEPVRNTLRNHLYDYCESAGRAFLEPLSLGGMPQDPFAWFSSMWSKGAFSNASPVIFLPLMADETERYALHRLNEQRDNLLREMKGALCIVGLAGFFRRAPVEAPDLWSLKARALEFFSFAPTDEVPLSSKLARLSAPPPGPYPYDVLLVAHRYDHAFGREVYRRLTRDGVVCSFEEAGARDEVIEDLRARLTKSRRVLLILSPELVAVEWARLQTALSPEEASELRSRLVLLLRRPTAVPAMLLNASRLDAQSDASFDREYPTLCRSLGGVPGEDSPLPAFVEGVLPPLPTSGSSRIYVPAPSLGERFVGRAELLWMIHRSLLTDRKAPAVLLYGLPGAGKSQVALEYARRFSPFFPGGVYWIGQRIDHASLSYLARAVGVVLGEGLDERQTMEAIIRELGRRPDSLLIVDALSGDDLDKLVLPGGAAHVLLTSRKKHVSPLIAPLRVNPLSPDDAYHLLIQERTPSGEDEQRAARGVAEALGGLPIALRVTSSVFRGHPERSYAHHLHALSAHTGQPGVGRLKGQLATAYGEQVLAAFEDALRALEPTPRLLLSIMALLGEAPLPLDLLRDIALLAGVEAAAVVGSIAALEESALVEQCAEGALTAHLFTAAVARASITEVEAKRITAHCDSVVQRRMGVARDDRDMSHVLDLAGVAPHAVTLFDRAEREGRLPMAIDLGVSIVSYQLHAGHYREAERLGRRALALSDRRTEIRSLLAVVLLERGALDEALDLARSVRLMDEASFGVDDPIVARDVTLEGAICAELGRYEEAIEHLTRARAILEGTLGQGHVSLAAVHHRDARALHLQGRLRDALPLAERAVMLTERAVGPHHPHVAERLRELGAITAMSDPHRARRLIRRALLIDETTLGRNHPAIAHDLAALSAALVASNRGKEARPFLERAQRIASAELLSEHRLFRAIAALSAAQDEPPDVPH